MQSPARWNIHQSETKTLSSSDKFDGKDHGLYGVLKEYLDRGGDNGWADALWGNNMIPDDVQDPSIEYKNLATQYGNISIKNIRAFK